MRDIRQEQVPRWYELELVRESFAVVLEPHVFRYVLDRIPQVGPCPLLGAAHGQFVRPKLGTWGINNCIKSYRNTDSRVTCEFYGELYRPDRNGVTLTTAGAESLDILTTLLATYDGPGATYTSQLITLDRVGCIAGSPDGGCISASLSPAVAGWIARHGSSQPLKSVRDAMLDSVRGTKRHVSAAVNAWCSDTRQLLLETNGDISLEPADRGEFNGRGYTVASKNVRHPPDHYALLCGLARVSELARRDGL